MLLAALVVHSAPCWATRLIRVGAVVPFPLSRWALPRRCLRGKFNWASACRSSKQSSGGRFVGTQGNWLGGLDSNQDIQIQSLKSYRLDDLPTKEAETNRSSSAKKGRCDSLFQEYPGTEAPSTGC